MEIPKRTAALAGAGAAALLVMACAWWAYGRWYLAPRAEVDEKIEAYNAGLEEADRRVAGAARYQQRLKALAGSAIGSTSETVSANLRTALNEIAASCGLERPTVSTGEAQAVAPPAGLGRADDIPRELRRQADFSVMNASLTGVGTLEQVTRTLATVNAQAWAHRIGSVRLTQTGPERSKVELQLSLTTMFFSDLPEGKPRERLWEAASEAELGALAGVVRKNVFRAPPPPAAPAAPQVATPAPSAPAAPQASLADWRVTGVIRGRGGAELWVRNERGGETRIVRIGERVMDAEFLGATGEVARVKVGEQEFEVSLNQTLGERRAIGRS